jgi:hypothetical protein
VVASGFSCQFAEDFKQNDQLIGTCQSVVLLANSGGRKISTLNIGGDPAHYAVVDQLGASALATSRKTLRARRHRQRGGSQKAVQLALESRIGQDMSVPSIFHPACTLALKFNDGVYIQDSAHSARSRPFLAIPEPLQ